MKLRQNSPMEKYHQKQSHWLVHLPRNRAMINQGLLCGLQNLWMEPSKYQVFCRVMLTQSKSKQLASSQIRRTITLNKVLSLSINFLFAFQKSPTTAGEKNNNDTEGSSSYEKRIRSSGTHSNQKRYFYDSVTNYQLLRQLKQIAFTYYTHG